MPARSWYAVQEHGAEQGTSAVCDAGQPDRLCFGCGADGGARVHTRLVHLRSRYLPSG